MKKKLDKSNKKNLLKFWALFSLGWIAGSTAYDLISGNGWDDLALNIVSGIFGSGAGIAALYFINKNK